MACFGYLRASTNQQNISHGRPEIDAYATSKGLGPVTYYEDEGVSGNAAWRRRKIADVIAIAQRGDWIIVQELSRLSRRPVDVLNLQETLGKKGVSLHAVKEGITWTPLANDSDQDTRTLLYAMFSKMERDKVSQRVRTGIANARLHKPGGLIGRMSQEVLDRRDQVATCHAEGLKQSEIAVRLTLPIVTVQNDLTALRRAGTLTSITRPSIDDLSADIEARRLRGDTYTEIARALNLPYTTVAKRISRSRHSI